MSAMTGKEFIEHYGVKGQKWGVRRQRPSGGVDTSKLSDQELRQLVERMRLDQQYSEMVARQNRSAGRAFVARIGSQAVNIAVSAVVAKAVQKAISSATRGS